jgi:hypothetical protein
MTFETWVCPSCGRRFARENTRHVCERHSVADKLDAATPHALTLYEGLKALAAECGEFFEEATKTAIEFKTPRTFIAIGLNKKWLNCSIWLPAPLHHARIQHNYPVSGNLYAIHFRIKSLDELDAQLKSWLCEAYFYLETRQAF